MMISCTCGKKYHGRPGQAGRRIQCTACGAEILVPTAVGDSAAEDDLPPDRKPRGWTAANVGFLVGLMLGIALAMFMVVGEVARGRKVDSSIVFELFIAALFSGIGLGFVGAIGAGLIGWFVKGGWSGEKAGVLVGAILAAALVGLPVMAKLLRGGEIEIGTILSGFAGAFIVFGLLGGLTGRIVSWFVRKLSPPEPADDDFDLEESAESVRIADSKSAAASLPIAEALPVDVISPAVSKREFYRGNVQIEDENPVDNVSPNSPPAPPGQGSG